MKRLFLSSAFNQVADKLVQLIPNPKGMKAVFVPTAKEPYADTPWADLDFKKLQDLGFEVSEYDIKGRTEDQICSDLKNIDVIFVCGGNSFYLLYHAKISGFDKAVVRLVDEGKIYIGSSAGSSITGPNIELTKTIDKLEAAPDLKAFDALNLTNFIVLNHMNNPKYTEKNQKILREYKGPITLVPINDDQAVLVEGDQYKVI